MKNGSVVKESVRTKERSQMIDITEIVSRAVDESKIKKWPGDRVRPAHNGGRHDQRKRRSGCET